MIASTCFSQKLSKDNSYYQSKDGSYYFIGDKVIVGQPTSVTKTFNFITAKTLQTPVSGDTITISGFYLKGLAIIATGQIGKTTYRIAFETAIATGELLSHEKRQLLNSQK